MVALKGFNEDEIEPMLRWCAAEGHDLTLIETMPLGAQTFQGWQANELQLLYQALQKAST